MYLAFKVVPNGRTTRRGMSRCVYPLFHSRRKESSLTSSWRKIRVCVRNLISLSFGFEPPGRVRLFLGGPPSSFLFPFFFLRKRERERGQEHTICSQQQQQQQQRSDNSRSFLRIERERMCVCVHACVCKHAQKWTMIFLKREVRERL